MLCGCIRRTAHVLCGCFVGVFDGLLMCDLYILADVFDRLLMCDLYIFVDVFDRLLMCDLHILADVFDRLLRRYAPPPLT
ncbi:MAG: hypothetical protein LUD00_00785 [Prevotellaceae bacterium]|nr:hypothetical protein [Prevotellaceae bacterium]